MKLTPVASNSFWKDRRNLQERLMLNILANGSSQNTGKISKLMKVRWDTVHNHLVLLELQGFVTKTQNSRQFDWTITLKGIEKWHEHEGF